MTADVTGDVTADVTGDVTADVTGDVTGDVTADVTEDVTGDVTADVTGDVKLGYPWKSVRTSLSSGVSIHKICDDTACLRTSSCRCFRKYLERTS